MKRVAKFDLDGNLIKVYNSVKECEKDTNCKSSSIIKCCSDKYNCNRVGNFVFQYYLEFTDREFINKIKDQMRLYSQKKDKNDESV